MKLEEFFKKIDSEVFEYQDSFVWLLEKIQTGEKTIDVGAWTYVLYASELLGYALESLKENSTKIYAVITPKDYWGNIKFSAGDVGKSVIDEIFSKITKEYDMEWEGRWANTDIDLKLTFLYECPSLAYIRHIQKVFWDDCGDDFIKPVLGNYFDFEEDECYYRKIGDYVLRIDLAEYCMREVMYFNVLIRFPEGIEAILMDRRMQLKDDEKIVSIITNEEGYKELWLNVFKKFMIEWKKTLREIENQK